MRKEISNFKLFSLAVLGVSLALSVVRVFVLLKNIELNADYPEKHYLIDKTPSTVAFCVVAFAVLVLIAVWSFAGKSSGFVLFDPLAQNRALDLRSPSGISVFVSALSGFLMFSSAVFFVFEVKSKDIIIMSLLMIAASLSFLCGAFVSKDKPASGKSVWLRLLTVVFSVCWLMVDFIEQNKYFLTSSSAFHIMALVFLTLFFVTEAQNAAGKLRVKAISFFGLSAAFLLIIDALPALLLSCFWMLLLDELVLMCAIELVLALYCICRVGSVKADSQSIEI